MHGEHELRANTTSVSAAVDVGRRDDQIINIGTVVMDMLKSKWSKRTIFQIRSEGKREGGEELVECIEYQG